MALSFEVRGMTCATCARRVQRAIAKVDGVEEAEVDLVRERARVVAPEDARDKLVRAVGALGYELVPIGQDAPAAAPRSLRPEATRAAIALVLAAAAMIAAMVPGVPGRPWLEIVLAAAAVIGPGLPILRKAAREARALDASMDLLVAIGALAALGSSVATAIRHGEHAHGYGETASGIVALVLLGRALEERAKQSASAAIRALAALRPVRARVVRHGETAEIPVSELREGDEVRVAANERIPADGEVIEGEGWVDEAWLTGESAPVLRRAGDRVLAGTLAAGNALRIRVRAAGEHTEIARVERMVEKAQASRAPIVRVADRVSARFVPAMLVIATLTAVSWLATGHGFEHAMRAAITVLVIACPCALGLATPTAITVAIGRAAGLGILVRDAASIERLARVRVIAIDKTGTLTQARPTLVAEIPLSGDPDRALAWAAALELESEHPVGRAIVDAAMARRLPVPDAKDVVAEAGVGIRGEVSGSRVEVRAVDDALAGEETRAQVERWRARAATVVLAAIDGTPCALFAVRDALREGARESIDALRGLGLELRLLSGDHPESAAAIARELGLGQDEVRAGIRPERKADEIASLRSIGPVAMVGDGVNDAPALAAADVGVAIGTGAEAAIESAAITLARPDPRRIADAISIARRTMRVIRQNLVWAFAYNVVMVPLAALGALDEIGGPTLASAAMAVSSLTVVLNSLRLRR